MRMAVDGIERRGGFERGMVEVGAGPLSGLRRH